MTTAASAKLTGSLLEKMRHLSHLGFELLPIGGGGSGKAPLLRFANRRVPLNQTISVMRKNGSSVYGIRLHDLVVVDVDELKPETHAMVLSPFGQTPVQVSTPRGRHYFYALGDAKLPNLRAQVLPIDNKSGRNAYVVGPGSIRPDGGSYDPVSGQLGTTPIPKVKDADRKPDLMVRSVSVVREGRRNSFLWQKACEYAPASFLKTSCLRTSNTTVTNFVMLGWIRSATVNCKRSPNGAGHCARSPVDYLRGATVRFRLAARS